MRRPMTLQQAALAVVRRLRRHGHQALWAGGCVRDMLLGHQPTDIDVATEAVPERIIELFRRTRKVGAKFGVVMVRQGSHWIETATFRSDVDYEDGRRPEHVVFTTAEQDALRRDFTVNGLFYDPIDERVIDYVDGRRDLAARVIRAIGDPAQRFAEDHLRMLRAVRFATRLDFQIDSATADAIREQADKITRISPERIREELEKMLVCQSRARAVRQIAGLGLLEQLWPDAHWPAGRVARAVGVLAALPADADFTLSLAALLHEFSPAQARTVGRALRCSNQHTLEAVWLIEQRDRPAEAAALPLAAFKKLIAHPRFDDLLALHKAVCESYGLPLEGNEAARRRREAIPADEVTPPPLVTGEDLIDLGLEPGPQFKQILGALYDEQLENRLTTRQQALERLRAFITDTLPWTR